MAKNLVHGPCGIHNPNAPCMIIDSNGNKICSKEYPKEFQDITSENASTYPLYRRRSPDKGGYTHTIMNANNNITFK